MIKLSIAHNSTFYDPQIGDRITLTWERQGSPGVLKFKLYKDKYLQLREGDAVRLIIDNKKFFFGYIFTMKYGNNNDIDITAYDQLRYFKNKDSYVYKGKRADELLTMIAKNVGLSIGKLPNTGYSISKKVEDNKTLFDIMQNALDETLMNNGRLYVLYDNFGKLRLTNISRMQTNIVINKNTAQSIDYQRTIDGETYNAIKLYYDDKDSGERKYFIETSKANIKKWGLLQYYQKVDKAEGASAKAKKLLELYNTPTRTFRVNKAFGDLSVRAGSSVIVQLKYGNLKLNNYMLVEKVVHTFENNSHFMDLTLRGGIINDA